MKKLCELYPQSTSTAEITDVKINSRDCGPGDLFICTMGATADRHDFVEDAVRRGASAIVASRPVEEAITRASQPGQETENRPLSPLVPVVYVENTNAELPYLCQRLFDHPEQELCMVGITGTNGKTTTATMIADMIGMDACGTIGTTGIRCSAFDEPIRNSCPDADRLYKYLRRFRNAGCTTVTMEATSEALAAGRLRGMTYDAVIFTNITRDHLNTHKTIENYVAAKHMLLGLVKEDGVTILNTDDAHFPETRAMANGRVMTYGKAENADLRILSVTGLREDAQEGMRVVFSFDGKEYTADCPLGGEFNAYNLAAAMLFLFCKGYSMEESAARAKRIRPVPGRAEWIRRGQAFGVVLDYAHTPDALRKICAYLKQEARGRLITVTGSAGGRDADKRGEMGEVVLSYSDLVIFTMDDPRDEDVNKIIDDLIGDGSRTNYVREPDRPAAIRKAFSMAEPDDIVLIAGKGRDNYMALGHEYVPYSDAEEIEKALDALS